MWAAFADERLSSSAAKLFQDPDNDVYLSAVSAWEIHLKWSVGKLRMDERPADFVQRELSERLLQFLPVELTHLRRLDDLAAHHKDPFDRLLVAQAVEEDLALMTRDQTLSEYPVKIVW